MAKKKTSKKPVIKKATVIKKPSARKSADADQSSKQAGSKQSGSKKAGSKATASKKPAIKKATSVKTHAAGSRPKGMAKKAGKKVAKKSGNADAAKQPVPGKLVYIFSAEQTDGDGSMRSLLGGKGANLAEMTAIGLPVPPGFTITTEACDKYVQGGYRIPHNLMNECHRTMASVQKETDRVFGDVENPMLVSVRSGAAVSMPGMMDTVLNLGLNDESVEGLATQTGNRRFAYDAYRRLVGMFGNVVMGVDHAKFEAAFDKIKKKYDVADDTEVPEEGMVDLAKACLTVYRKSVGDEFPQNPFKQLELAIEAVFKSWDSDRAQAYRRINGIIGLKGTAVNIQAMVYGNMGDDSGTGVAFTRDPNTGENKLFGEFLVNAQGEDVVAGTRTPLPASEMSSWDKKSFQQLQKIKTKLESHYKDMQDIEFTIESGKLWMLQTRAGKRHGAAAVRIACDMVKEGLLTEEEAVLRIPAGDLIQVLLPGFAPKAKKNETAVAKGLPASPGAAVGKPAFTADEAKRRASAGEQVVLVRTETSPEDVEGMHSAMGILTSTGGMTSHAAVVARCWGKCCVVGAGELYVDEKKGTIKVGKTTITRDNTLSIDGSTGEIFVAELETVEAEVTGDFAKVMRWADKHRTMLVRANADTPEDARTARDLGAQGIGLCRTEHMFFDADRLTPMREMILADTPDDRRAALEKLVPYQRDDFIAIFEVMKGLPVTIRLFDPPLHEFLPQEKAQQDQLAKQLGITAARVRQRVADLKETNPMLGHRGCRLAVSYPEILEMQVRAISEATIECLKRKVRAQPEIMVPLVGAVKELAYLKELILETIHEVRREQDYAGRLDIKIGTMVEVPRACVRAEEIAEVADFFSFGTNDLTQLTFGYSRDDINDFLGPYLTREILDADPFQNLDQRGVGELVRLGTERGRAGNDQLKVGLCGEHGGDPKSVHFCQTVGLDYVSCSPFRVPIARLAAAQAALMHGIGPGQNPPARK
ncbi:MAG: pyruvate, phosphate dikinase [Planctomycetota bacterium]